MSVPQVAAMAHLRPYRPEKCRTCGKTATEALHTGLNDLIAHYCTRHAKVALRAFKEGHSG